MKITLLLLSSGLTGWALLATAGEPTHLRTPVATIRPAAPPYVARLRALEQDAAEHLRTALAELPGIDAVEVFPGDRRAAHLHMRTEHYLSRSQVETVVEEQGLELDAFETPQWAKLRVYVAEAAGGG